MHLTLISLLGASIVVGQSTLDAIMFGAMPGDYVASVMDANKDATTMTIGCAKKDDCGWILAGATVTQGPSTYNLHFDYTSKGNVISESEACVLDPAKDQAKCTVSEVQAEDGSSTSGIDSTTTNYKKGMMHVTVTAGAEKLAGAAQASKTADSGAMQTDTSKTSAGKNGAKSTNAGPMVTGNAVLAGVAAVAGALAL